MGKVIDICAGGDHLSGEAKCMNCDNTWQAVSPVGRFDELQCPVCNTMKGVMSYGCVPEVYWECDCGCHLFSISGKTHELICWQCGTGQRFGEE